MRKGDLIVEIGGREVWDTADVMSAVAAGGIGARLSCVLLRDGGSRITVSILPQAKPSNV